MHKVIEKYILDNNLSNEAEVWPLLKYQMTRHIILSKGGVEDMEFKSKSYVSLLIFLIVSLCNLYMARFRNKKAAYFGAFSRVSINEGMIYDEFLSSDKQQKQCILYHCSNFEDAKILTCFTHGVIFENLIVKLLVVFIKHFGYYSRTPSLSEDFIELLIREYGVSQKQVEAILQDYECKKAAYKKLMKWLGVQNVEIVSAYTKPAIVSAANELGIKTLEYQHGLLAPYHPSYHYAGVELWRSSMLPTRLKLYSSFWQIKMREANYVPEEEIEFEGALPQACEEVKKQIYEQVGNDKFFLFTGQGICYVDIAEFINGLIDKYPNYTVVYRPHPRENRNYIQLISLVNNSRLKVIDRKVCLNTLALINAAQAHFSIFSSCHFDALELLGKTYVLDVIDNNIMKMGKDDKNIIFVSNANQIYDI